MKIDVGWTCQVISEEHFGLVLCRVVSGRLRNSTTSSTPHGHLWSDRDR
jgi:hypothetical protein